MKIISNTPIYVWPLLAYLLWGGWKSRKTNTIPWKPLVILPAIMFIWSLLAVVTRYGSHYIFVWAICITLGVWLGSLTVRRLELKFDKQRSLIEIGGSWMPMILSMSIFSLRYILGTIDGIYPELNGNMALLAIENMAIIVSGMFLGRLVGYRQRFKASSHMDLG